MVIQLNRRTRINIVLTEANVVSTEPNLEKTIEEVISYLEGMGHTIRNVGFWRSESNGVFTTRLTLCRLPKPANSSV